MEITNSGDEYNAVFDFTIPRGEPGGGGIESLAVVDTAAKPFTAPGPIVFTDPALVADAPFTYTPGNAIININQPGVYQAIFHCTVEVNPGTTIPSQILIQLYRSGTPLAGSATRHTFTASGEVANVTLSTPFDVTSIPAQLEVYVEEAGYTITDSSLTILRLS